MFTVAGKIEPHVTGDYVFQTTRMQGKGKGKVDNYFLKGI